MTTVLFTGGGTGGHLMPALAIAEEMVRLEPSVRPFFVGSRRGVEASVLPQRPWPYELLPLEPLWRRRWWRNFRLPFALFASLQAVRGILRRERPSLVVGTGGYVAGPVVWAAMNRGIPAVLQEQNAYPGLATRRLARRARQVHLGFPEARSRLSVGSGDRGVRQRQPDPAASRAAPLEDRVEAEVRLSRRTGRSCSSPAGARGRSRSTGRLPAPSSPARSPPGRRCSGSAGRGCSTSSSSFRAAGLVAVEPFVDPVADAYAAADLVVSRAGAMTFAGLSAWGLPAILVPLPTAAAGHQLSNARAARAMRVPRCCSSRRADRFDLGEAVGALLADSARMAGLRTKMLARARPNAATDIASEALKVMWKTRDSSFAT